jgi:hypothetical protein
MATTTTKPSWIAAAERRLAGEVEEEAPRATRAAVPPSPRAPHEPAAPVVTAAALEAEYEAALAGAATARDAGDAHYAAADRVAAAAHRRRTDAFLTGLADDEAAHELYPHFQHERRLCRVGGETDEAWEKRVAGSRTRQRPGAS